MPVLLDVTDAQAVAQAAQTIAQATGVGYSTSELDQVVELVIWLR